MCEANLLLVTSSMASVSTSLSVDEDMVDKGNGNKDSLFVVVPRRIVLMTQQQQRRRRQRWLHQWRQTSTLTTTTMTANIDSNNDDDYDGCTKGARFDGGWCDDVLLLIQDGVVF